MATRYESRYPASISGASSPRRRRREARRTETYIGSLWFEHDSRGDAAGRDVGDRLIDLVQPSGFPDHSGLAGGMQLEYFAQVLSGADDRADDRDAVQDGLEDRGS
jgi:hypothetical protein